MVRVMRIGIILLMVVSIMLAGCASQSEVEVREISLPDVTGNAVLGEMMEGSMKVEIITNKGNIVAEIYKEKTPITAGNFLKLVDQKFYDGLTFHRHVPGFVIQGGDPKGDGTGGSDEKIKLEIVEGLKHDKYVFSMARSQDRDSASSQFFITLEPTPNLDGDYAVFGRVLEGQDVVDQIRPGDVMETVSVVE